MARVFERRRGTETRGYCGVCGDASSKKRELSVASPSITGIIHLNAPATSTMRLIGTLHPSPNSDPFRSLLPFQARYVRK